LNHTGRNSGGSGVSDRLVAAQYNSLELLDASEFFDSIANGHTLSNNYHNNDLQIVSGSSFPVIITVHHVCSPFVFIIVDHHVCTLFIIKNHNNK